jgi:DNA-binding MarR family transcriptional regulator
VVSGGPARFTTPERVVAETGQRVAEQQAYLQLIRTAAQLGGEVGALLARHGLSGKQYNALRAIRRSGRDGATISEIENDMVAQDPDPTRLVDRLEKGGLVTRQRDPGDRRVVRVRLTEAGAALLAALDGPLVELHRRQLGHLAVDEIESLCALLRRARRDP